MTNGVSMRGYGASPGKRRRWRALRTTVALTAALAVLAVPELAEASISEVNQQRAAAGLPPVSEDSGLTSLAQQHSAQMATSSSLVHSSNLGGTVGTVAPSYQAAAENVGYGESVPSVTNMFMASPTHRSALLGNYNTAGVGVVVGADGRVWVTQLFARVGGGAAVAPSSTAPRYVPASSGRRYVRTKRRCRYVRGRKRCQYVRVSSRRGPGGRLHRHRHRHRSGRIHYHYHRHRR